MLYNDGRVSHQRPEVVGLHARVALEVLQEGGLVRVVVRVYSILSAKTSFKHARQIAVNQAHMIASPRAASGSACADDSGFDSLHLCDGDASAGAHCRTHCLRSRTRTLYGLAR